MTKDGGVRNLFRNKLHSFQWTSVETAGTASGVPDSEFCSPDGIQGWIECKQTKAFFVTIRPLQIAWLMRRCRYGGNAWIAVRRVPSAAKYAGVDELWLMKGDQAEALYYHGLTGVKARKWEGGPGSWDWAEIQNTLLHPAHVL